MKVALTVVVTPFATVTVIGRKKPADESLVDVLVNHNSMYMYVLTTLHSCTCCEKTGARRGLFMLAIAIAI